jgi:hypothetical protein
MKDRLLWSSASWVRPWLSSRNSVVGIEHGASMDDTGIWKDRPASSKELVCGGELVT